MSESLLTPQELADWLKMSRVWVYKQAEKGLLPFHRVGDAIRFDPKEIMEYLTSREGLKKMNSWSRGKMSQKAIKTSKGYNFVFSMFPKCFYQKSKK